jgi:AbrB family looped-hinge helix DNA binding protein
MKYEAKVTSKGQLTLPVRLRKALSIEPGDKVVFVEDEQGRIVLNARTRTLADLRGIVRVRGIAPIEEWIEEARSARADQALRSLTKPKSRRR